MGDTKTSSVIAAAFFALLLCTGANSSPVVDNFLTGEQLEEKGISCSTCKFLIELLHDLWGSDVTGDCVAEAVTYLCTRLGIEDHFICKGIAGDFKDEFVYIVGQLVVNPNQLCSLLVDDCGSFFDPLNVTWTLPIPGNKPPYRPPQLPAANAPKLKVLHLSDLHFDMEYKVGAEASCKEPLCCRPPNDGNEKRRRRGAATKDDPIKDPAGHWGHIGLCDSPYWLGVSMMQHIAATHHDIDYVVVSGDYESHADWNYKHESHAAIVRNVSDLIKMYLPNVPAYMAVGNHEGVPIDNFAPHWAPEKFWMDWLYGAMADAWRGWVPQAEDANVRYRGCFVKQLYPGLRMISLNNGLGDKNNFYLYINQTDPDGTMTWFLQQLAAAEAAGDKVHVVAHIPGGAGEMLESWSLVYYQAINRYENTVAAQFFGHTHSDEWYLTYLDPDDFRSRPTSVIFSAPSLTTYSDYNPGYRIYTLDGNYPGSSFQILDFENWFLNLTEANANPANPVWQHLYSAKQDYGLSSMFPSEWNNLIERFKIDDTLFNNFVKFYYRRSDVHCDAKCKPGMLCDRRQFHHSDLLCTDLHAPPARQRQQQKRDRLRNNVEPAPTVDLQKEAQYLKMRKAAASKDDDKCPI